MGTKNNPGKFNCYAKAEPDEPIFVLRANDPIAPMVVRLWAAQYWQHGGEQEKVEEARAVADAMEKWQRERVAKQLDGVDSREGLRSVLGPLRAEHDKHAQPVGGCPYCEGAVT